MNRKYQDYLNSDQWNNKRLLVIERDNGKCTACEQDGHDVHHLTYERIFNERLDDLTLLCRRCHKTEHNTEMNFTEYENAQYQKYLMLRISKKKKQIEMAEKKQKRMDKKIKLLNKELSSLVEDSL